MKIILFGIGGYYEENKEIIFKTGNTQIIGLADNNRAKQGKTIDGYRVYAIADLPELEFDLIVIMSMYAYDIEEQLIQVGIDKQKIKRFKEYIGYCDKGEWEFLGTGWQSERKSLIIISVYLDMNGGSIAAKYAAMALKGRGYYVALAAPDGNYEFIQSVVEEGIGVYLYKNMEYAEYSELEFLNPFDAVIVNTYQMYSCVSHIMRYKKVVWWLHESADMYEGQMKLWGRPDLSELIHTDIYAVSQTAQNTFKKYFQDIQAGILEYGIPYVKSEKRNKVTSKKIFGVIGNICDIKGQDLLMDAAQILSDYADQCEFWLIGRLYENEYCQRIADRAKEMKNVFLKGEYSQQELFSVYQDIDVVVVPSRMDSLPIVATEVLMLEKQMILSDSVGTLQYLQQGVVQVFRSGDAEDLAKKIEWELNAKESENTEAKKRIYDRYFSMDAFADRLIRAIESEDKYN